MLNFGHTAGHALEAVTKYKRFRHGEAIAYGMLVAAEIAVARGVMPDADRQALAKIIMKLGPLPPVGDLSTQGSARGREARQEDRRRHAALRAVHGDRELDDSDGRDRGRTGESAEESGLKK